MPKRPITHQKECLPGIEVPEDSQRSKKPKFKIERALWTENKAQLIERYLLYFVYITKHGTYIDGFAGPQREDQPEAWAAKLVLSRTEKVL